MSDWLKALYQSVSGEGEGALPIFSYLTTRAECCERIAKAKGYDLVVLGGGLTGAVTAHQAALAGIRVLVLHESYFGSCAQLWSVAYCDLQRAPPLVRLKSARALNLTATRIPHHLQHPIRISERGEERSILQRMMHTICSHGLHLDAGDLPGCDERSLIRETILAARQEGALALSDIEISYVESEGESGLYSLALHDPISGWRAAVRAGSLLLDPATIRIPSSRLGRAIGPATFDEHILVRIVALLQRPLEIEPQRFFTGRIQSSEYLVARGETPNLVEIIVRNPALDRVAQVEQIIRIEGSALRQIVSLRDLRQRQVYRHEVEQYGGLFIPRERGPWDAGRSAQRVIAALRSSEHQVQVARSQLVQRVLPGAVVEEEIERFRSAARVMQICEQTIAQVIQRWHGRVRYIAECTRGFEVVCPGVLRGEVELAFRSDQIATLDDLIFGALALDADPEWRSKVEPLAALLAELSAGAPLRLVVSQ